MEKRHVLANALKLFTFEKKHADDNFFKMGDKKLRSHNNKSDDCFFSTVHSKILIAVVKTVTSTTMVPSSRTLL